MPDQSQPRRQFVQAKFRPEDSRSYTYHNDGEPFAIGDKGEVDGRGGKPMKVDVVGLSDEPPPFPTKPIRRPLPKADPESQASLLDEGKPE